MANNYTVSTFTAIETIGDQVANANMISSGTLTITPNAGYVIQASDFSIGSSLPSEVSSVSFSNSGTANTPGNTVIATVNFQSSFTVTGDITLNIDIDGAATFLEEDEDVLIDVGGTIFEINDTNVTTAVSAVGGTTVSGSDSGNTTTTTVIGVATPNKAKFIATIQLDAAANYYFRRQPYFTYQNLPESVLRLSLSSVVRDSNNFITRYIFNVVYKNNVDTFIKSGSKAILNYKVELIPTSSTTKQITNVVFGDTIVDFNGDNRLIKVFGTNNSELDLTITDSTDGKSILDTNLSNTTVLNPIYGSIDALNIKLQKGTVNSRGLTNEFLFKQSFPAYDNVIRTTTFSSGFSSATTVTVASLTDVRVGDRLRVVIDAATLKGIDTSSNVTVTAINSSTECVVSEAITVNNNQTVVFTREQSYNINLFPKRDVNGNLTTTLNSNIPSTLPTYTINQHADPKLRLLIATVTSGKFILPDQSDTFSIYAIGKPNAFPSDLTGLIKNPTELLFNGSTLRSPRSFSISYSVTHASGTFSRTSNSVVWSSTEAFNSSPTSTSSSWTNSVPENNGGTHIEITNIVDTLLSDASGFTITAQVTIHKWGTEDVTMVLDLDKIYTPS